jgi:hypothetical protein
MHGTMNLKKKKPLKNQKISTKGKVFYFNNGLMDIPARD